MEICGSAKNPILKQEAVIMSQYIEFFVKSKEDNFTCIASFPRSHIIYQTLVNEVPYGKICKLNFSSISRVILSLTEKKVEWRKRKEEYDNMWDRIGTFNNSVQEKLEAMAEFREALLEIKENIDDIDNAINYLKVFQLMVEEMQTDSTIGLYCGIEVGEPTVEDIKV